MSDVVRDKMRRELLARRKRLGAAERERLSDLIYQRFIGLEMILEAETIFIYAAFRSEVETIRIIDWLIAANKTVAVPLTLVAEKRLLAVAITDPKSQLTPGYCGIPEPLPHLVSAATIDPGELDVVVVPGSVFDERGGRLGYGGGYYDRFFDGEAPGAVRMALAFELQLVAAVEMREHDRYMDWIITDERIIDCGRKRNAEDGHLS